MPTRQWGIVIVLLGSLAVTGCESLQRKVTRKPKTPPAAPTPIISFRDYTQAATPLDRYRKHYMMFDYWNAQLVDALRTSPLNPKRYRKASNEALVEMETLKGLLEDDLAGQMGPLVAERAKLHRRLQSPGFNQTSSDAVRRTLEEQARQLHRQFSWKDVQERLKPAQPQQPSANAQEGHAPAP